jgi:hypothetical protein
LLSLPRCAKVGGGENGTAANLKRQAKAETRVNEESLQASITLPVAAGDEIENVELSVVMPCLNHAENMESGGVT